MREIVLDTETTGLSPGEGHRIVEIGCLELRHHLPTGRSYQAYINPERAMPAGAESVHGLSDAFLADKPRFAEIADAFLDFIGDAPLVIHNASFDMGFLNAELARLGKPALVSERAVDTLTMARQRFPGAPANLDALCRRFAIDASDRSYHGALKDARLLADVYLELVGGRQPRMSLAPQHQAHGHGQGRRSRTAVVIEPTGEEARAHTAMVHAIADALWLSVPVPPAADKP